MKKKLVLLFTSLLVISISFFLPTRTVQAYSGTVQYLGKDMIGYTFMPKEDIYQKYGNVNTMNNIKIAGANTFADWITPFIAKTGPVGFATSDEINAAAKVDFPRLEQMLDLDSDLQDWDIIAKATYSYSTSPNGKVIIYKLTSITYSIEGM